MSGNTGGSDSVGGIEGDDDGDIGESMSGSRDGPATERGKMSNFEAETVSMPPVPGAVKDTS